MSVTVRLLSLEWMSLESPPNAMQIVVVVWSSEQRLGEDSVRYVDSAIEKDGAHHSLEAVGHGVPQFGVVTKVVSVRVQHVLLQPHFLGQDG